MLLSPVVIVGTWLNFMFLQRNFPDVMPAADIGMSEMISLELSGLQWLPLDMLLGGVLAIIAQFMLVTHNYRMALLTVGVLSIPL